MEQENGYQPGKLSEAKEEIKIASQDKTQIVVLYEPGYELIYSHASGGIIWRHELVDVNGIDYDEVLEIAIDKASCGCIVHILPILNEDDPLRKSIFEGAKKRKCPDMKVNGFYTEIKTPTEHLHSRKINKNIKIAHDQADCVIIKLLSEFSIQRLVGIAKGRFISHATLTLIEFKMGDKYYSYKRSEFI